MDGSGISHVTNLLPTPTTAKTVSPQLSNAAVDWKGKEGKQSRWITFDEVRGEKVENKKKLKVPDFPPFSLVKKCFLWEREGEGEKWQPCYEKERRRREASEWLGHVVFPLGRSLNASFSSSRRRLRRRRRRTCRGVTRSQRTEKRENEIY